MKGKRLYKARGIMLDTTHLLRQKGLDSAAEEYYNKWCDALGRYKEAVHPKRVQADNAYHMWHYWLSQKYKDYPQYGKEVTLKYLSEWKLKWDRADKELSQTEQKASERFFAYLREIAPKGAEHFIDKNIC